MYIASHTRYEKMKYNRCGRERSMLPAVLVGLSVHDLGIPVFMRRWRKRASRRLTMESPILIWQIITDQRQGVRRVILERSLKEASYAVS